MHYLIIFSLATWEHLKQHCPISRHLWRQKVGTTPLPETVYDLLLLCRTLTWMRPGVPLSQHTQHEFVSWKFHHTLQYKPIITHINVTLLKSGTVFPEFSNTCCTVYDLWMYFSCCSIWGHWFPFIGNLLELCNPSRWTSSLHSFLVNVTQSVHGSAVKLRSNNRPLTRLYSDLLFFLLGCIRQLLPFSRVG